MINAEKKVIAPKNNEIPEIIADENGGMLNGTDGSETIRGSQERDWIVTGEGDDTVMAHGGSDIIQMGKGRKIVYGGEGEDMVLLEGTGVGYKLHAQDDGSVKISGNGVSAILDNVEYLRFKSDLGFSNTFAFTDLIKGKTNLISMDSRAWLVGTDADEALIGLGDFNNLKGGMGDDHLIGAAGKTNVLYDGTLFDYAITKNADGTVTVRHEKYGTDTLRNIDKLVFEGNDIAVSVADLPDEWLGETSFASLVKFDDGLL